VANAYFNNTTTLIPGSTARANDVETKLYAVATGFDLVAADIGLKMDKAGGTTAGTFVFTNSIDVPTQATGEASTKAASTAFVAASVAAFGTLGDLVDVAVTTTGTSAVNTRELVNTAGGAIIRTLPASPSVGQMVAYKDAKNNFSVNKLTIQPAAGQAIEDSAVLEAMDVTDKYAYFSVKWDGLAWRVL
jgi:hypothetical protein